MTNVMLYLIVYFAGAYAAIRIISLVCHYLRSWCWNKLGFAFVSSRASLYMAVIFTILMLLVSPGVDYNNQETVTSRVVWKERITYGSVMQEHFYLIYTIKTDGSPLVFSNTDSISHGKYDSSGIYTLLEIGKSYEFKLAGIRVPILSKYQNVITYKPVVSEPQK